MSSHKRRSLALSFVDRHRLWSGAQVRAAISVEKAISQKKLELVRFSFPDQHGVLRGKTLVAAEASYALRSGVTMTSTLFAKDTAHRTVFPVFEPGAGLAISEMGGAGNFIMVADPQTFRTLPWAENTGWVLCDCYFANGKKVPLGTRQLCRDALSKLSKAGFDYVAGLEIEFHLFKIEDLKLATDTLDWPAEPPLVSHTTHGYQYLTEGRYDQVAPILDILRKSVVALGLPLQSVEVEFGPSQYEFTFAPEIGIAAADAMVLLRSTLKQVARRHGYLVSFMCRPRLPNTLASGWHLHQSLVDTKSKANAFTSQNDRDVLSPLGRKFLAGLLANAGAATAFTTPTINGYKRYRGRNTMAPVQAVWAKDNRGVMIRIMGECGDPATHIENRSGEPLANPYLYIASQIYAGLDGIARSLDPGPAAEAPYQKSAAEALPAKLEEALAALRASACFRAGFGEGFVDYYVHMKEAEITRCRKETTNNPEGADVSEWERREYFDML
ncbi:MAG TPA: glutamine synthetase family protein [Xanthobacteraceae bacterium]|jgi:glutamine synthetase|nr:glutamine synthetase family protein [Xanthobacteraceae bacterium]